MAPSTCAKRCLVCKSSLYAFTHLVESRLWCATVISAMLGPGLIGLVKVFGRALLGKNSLHGVVLN